ncbi:protein FAR1-RELATED SEQUENCE 5-like [Lotus japonicus]|uniref:protein FAR1-RELATED SEQUENCE 5-like n=1 Tax=Lotus japonicus TaxID=34305 RepID=UPI002582DC40|nr:protein FAR1-RELATED SEQUENCE 5-like [Lotus japonicus]
MESNVQAGENGEEEAHVSLGNNGTDNDVENGGSTVVEDEDDHGAVYEKSILDLTEDDIMGMEFDSEEDVIKFYERYAQCYGFGVRRDNVYRSANGYIVTRQLVCSKEGVRHRKYLQRRDRVRVAKGITRVSCPARFRVRFESNSGKWRVGYFVKNHNHVLAPVDKVHLISSFRHLNDSDKAQINSLKLHGVRTCNIMGLMLGQKGSHEALGFTKKDLFNHIDKEKRIRVGNGDAVAALSYFQAKAEGDPMFFSKYTKTEDENLKDLFWSDGVSRVDYHAFGDVIAFDSTYKRNKYNKPLVIFCGYNHHGQTTVFACALVTDESIETYKWVLETFAECMFQKHPKGVVTDGDLAMKEAISCVFPNARHRLCGWHIQQKALQKLKNSDFLDDFKVLIYGNFNPDRFDRVWAKVMEKYGFGDDEWLTRMYGMKEMWATAFMGDKFFAGIRTTSMCEGINSFIKSYVQCKNSLIDFIHNFERVVKEYRHNELVADFNTMYTEPLPTTSLGYIERGFSQKLTRSMFNEVKTQIQYVGGLNIIQRTEVNDVVMVKMNKALYERREYVVLYDKNSSKFVCDCGHFEYYGIPCSHMICAMRNERLAKVPDSLICKRWSRTAKVDYMNQINDTVVGNDSKKLAMLRRGVLSAACNILSEIACENVNDFSQVLQDIYKLAESVQMRRVRNKSVHTGPFLIGDPAVVITKGRKKKGGKKIRLCSRCRMPGHTIRTCPEMREGQGVGSHAADMSDSSMELDEVDEVLPYNVTMPEVGGKGKGKGKDQIDNEACSQDLDYPFMTPMTQDFFHPGMNNMDGFTMFPQFPQCQNLPSYPGIRICEPGSSTQVPNFVGYLNEVERKAKAARIYVSESSGED